MGQPSAQCYSLRDAISTISIPHLRATCPDVSSTATGGKDGVDVEASNKDSGEDSIGGTYGEIAAVGLEVGGDFGELGSAILDGIISDIKDDIQQLQQGISFFSTGSSNGGSSNAPPGPNPN